MMKEEYKIEMAGKLDVPEILALYKTHLYGPADWNEYYPNEETVDFDLSRDSLFIMKNEKKEIIATISIDSDQEVENLPCWSEALQPSGELARLCVRKDYQNHGIARQMMQHTFDVMKKRGCKGVHILVKTGHEVALRAYAHLNYQQVGECELFNKSFVCLEREL